MNIIAVDDERLPLHSLHTAICEALPEESVACFRAASEALEFAKKHTVDVAFLDINMGAGMNGLELAGELAAVYPSTNIIFVTGYSEYYEAAFDQYASGYVKKPVLAKRILKEMSHLRYPIEEKTRTVGPYTINSTTQRVYLNGEDSLLKPKEYQMLLLFVDNPGVCFTAEHLFKHIWGDEPIGNIDTVKMHVSRLRTKLGMTMEGSAEIKVRRGKGYYLEWMP